MGKGLLIFALFSCFLLSGCSSGSGYYGDGYYNDYEEEPIASESWDCTGNCSGHEAGYEWASDHGITDPDDCGGNSASFIEGCETYANEVQMDKEEEYDYEYEPDYY